MTKLLGSLIRSLAVLLLAGVAWAQPIGAQEKQDVLKDVQKVLEETAFVPGVNLKDWAPHLEKNRAAIDKAATNDEFTRAVNGALRDFGISHLRLRTPTQAKRREQTSMIGVGITARDGDNMLQVLDVVPRSPAAEAGIQPGDLIVGVDGKPPETTAELAGEENSKVELTVKRGEQPEMKLSVTRARFSTVRPETLTWIDEQTAVLKVYTFAAGYSAKNVESLLTEAAKAKYLLVDLRSNGGGSTASLRHLLSMLLPHQTVIGTFVGRPAVNRWREAGHADSSDVVGIAGAWDRKYTTSRTSTPEPFAGKIAVLINRGSASASEIAAAALRECVGAPLVGSRSAGAVLSSTFKNLSHGFSLQYPSQDYVTAKGVRLEKHPLAPDAEAPDPKKGEKDLCIERAIELLKRAETPEAPHEVIPMTEKVGAAVVRPLRRAA